MSTSTYRETDTAFRWKGDRDPIWRGEFVLPSGHTITATYDWVLADHVRLERAKERAA